MNDALCNISAFRYHRLPPQIIGLLPPFPIREADKRRQEFFSHPLIQEVTGVPVHLMFQTRAARSRSPLIKAHLAKHEPPFGSVVDTPLGIKVASPLYCLLQLAQELPEIQLMMAMYELCGSFAVFQPTAYIEELLNQASGLGVNMGASWHRVYDSNGNPTSLWKRPPLVTIEELLDYARQAEGMRGCAAFRRAAQRITGITASPFEAQLSMLLSLPRRLGGEGLQGFENNARIRLSNDARKISGKTCCYADFLFEETSSGQPLVVECQGKMVHDSYESLISDSERLTALRQTGFNVILLTYPQIASAHQFDVICRLIARELGKYYREKSAKELTAQHELRRNLFIDWATIGN